MNRNQKKIGENGGFKSFSQHFCTKFTSGSAFRKDCSFCTDFVPVITSVILLVFKSFFFSLVFKLFLFSAFSLFLLAIFEGHHFFSAVFSMFSLKVFAVCHPWKLAVFVGCLQSLLLLMLVIFKVSHCFS